MKSICLATVMAAVFGCMLGCNVETPDQRLAKAMEQAQGLAQKSDIDGAVAVLEKAMGVSALAQQRPAIFRQVIEILLNAGRDEQAGSRIYQALEKDPSFADPAIELYAGHMLQAGKQKEFGAWCERAAKLKLPDALLGQLIAWRAYEQLRASEFQGAVDIVSSALPRLTPPTGQQVMENVALSMVNAGQPESAAKLMAMAEASADKVPGWRAAAIAIRVETDMAQGAWAEVDAKMRQAVADLADPQLFPLFRRTVARCIGAGKTDIAGGLCEHAIAQAPDKAQTAAAAVQIWIGDALKQRDAALALQRLSRVVESRVAPSQAIQAASRVFPLVMDKGSDDNVRQLIGVCEQLLPRAPSDADRGTLRGTIMDASFRVEDYAKALTQLGAGIPGRDARWIEVMSNKVKAHMALKEGRKQEAADRFRQFTEYVRTEGGDQTDPVSGVTVSKETILALNSKRIGDILLSMGKNQEAAAAYKEARAAYEKALKKTTDGSPEQGQIKAEMEKLPAAE